MVKDSSKVISIPKNIPFQDQVSYICSCNVCVDRQTQSTLNAQNESQALRYIEETLLMSPLANKNINLKVSTQKNTIAEMSNQELMETIEQKLLDIRYIYWAVKATEKFIIQFNKKYRHPYVCELHDNTVQMLESLIDPSDDEDIFTKIEKYNYLLSHLHTQIIVLQTIEKASFLDSELILELLYKFKKAKQQIVELSKRALELRYRDEELGKIISAYPVTSVPTTA